MKMTDTTARKIENLHRMTVQNVEITHDQYNRLFAGENVPSWATLKAHDMLRVSRRVSRLPEGECFTTTPEWERETVYYILSV